MIDPNQPLRGKRVLVFVGGDYEDMELQYPKYRLIEAGAAVTVAGTTAGEKHLGKHGYPQTADAAVADLDPADFDGVVVPGGWMPDKLRRDADVKKFVAAMDAAGKCVASICHGGWVCASAKVISGKRYTGSPGIMDDMIHAGVLWEDAAVVIDGHHVSSRKPDDLPDFCRAIIAVMTGSQQGEADTPPTAAHSDSGKHFG